MKMVSVQFELSMSQFGTDVDNLSLTIILRPALSSNGEEWDLRLKTRLKASDSAKEGFYMRINKIENIPRNIPVNNGPYLCDPAKNEEMKIFLLLITTIVTINVLA